MHFLECSKSTNAFEIYFSKKSRKYLSIRSRCYIGNRYRVKQDHNTVAWSSYERTEWTCNYSGWKAHYYFGQNVIASSRRIVKMCSHGYRKNTDGAPDLKYTPRTRHTWRLHKRPTLNIGDQFLKNPVVFHKLISVALGTGAQEFLVDADRNNWIQMTE